MHDVIENPTFCMFFQATPKSRASFPPVIEAVEPLDNNTDQNEVLLTCVNPLGSLSHSMPSMPVGCDREGEENIYSVQISVNSSEVKNTYW